MFSKEMFEIGRGLTILGGLRDGLRTVLNTPDLGWRLTTFMRR